MQMRRWLVALAAVACTSANAGGWGGALGGLGEAMQRQGEQQQDLEGQKEMMQLQHRQELERMRYQFEMQRQAEERTRQSEERARQQAATNATRPSDEELRRRIQVLEQTHPDWRRIDASPSYKNWVNNAPPEILRLLRSWEPANWAYVFSAYKRDMKMTP